MPVAFLDARPRECRFPVAGEGVGLIVCGAAVSAAGGPYCPSCRRLSYRATPADYVPPPSTMWVPIPERETTPDLVELFA